MKKSERLSWILMLLSLILILIVSKLEYNQIVQEANYKAVDIQVRRVERAYQRDSIDFEQFDRIMVLITEEGIYDSETITKELEYAKQIYLNQ